MYRRACHILQRPLVDQGDDRQDDINALEDRNGFDGFVEVLREEVEEEFGPEEGFERGSNVVCILRSRRQWRLK